MLIRKIEFSNFRGYSKGSLAFKEGFNLIVGVNGVGKSTILEAIRVSLSHVLPLVSGYEKRWTYGFRQSDIKLGAKERMEIRADFTTNNAVFGLRVQRDKEGQTDDVEDKPSAQTEFVPPLSSLERLLNNEDVSKHQPIGLYFSTHRSKVSNRKSDNAITGQGGAHYESLIHNRDFNLREIAEWFSVQMMLGKESDELKSHIVEIVDAVSSLMPGFTNFGITKLGPNYNGPLTLSLSKDGNMLPANWLSDGERSMLSLGFDLARRLIIANPGLSYPIRDGRAIVLIDELDLHLHPRWQRLVVKQLTSTFPNCQFICTTHSPQLIGEVPAERVTIIGEGTVYHPRQTFGVDSSRVLEEVMGAAPRNAEVQEVMNTLFGLIDDEKLDEAREVLQRLIEMVGESDTEVLRAETMIMFLED